MKRIDLQIWSVTFNSTINSKRTTVSVNEGGVRFSEHSERIPNPTVYNQDNLKGAIATVMFTNNISPLGVMSEMLGLAKRIPSSSVYVHYILIFYFILFYILIFILFFLFLFLLRPFGCGFFVGGGRRAACGWLALACGPCLPHKDGPCVDRVDRKKRPYASRNFEVDLFAC